MNLTSTEHAQLLRELAAIAQEHAGALRDDGFSVEAADCFKCAARARQAAEEIEGEPKTEREWYAYHFEDGMELFGSSDEAKSQADLWLADDAQAAFTDGWHEYQELLAWGYIVPVETAQVTQRLAPGEVDGGGPDFDEYVVYELRPVAALQAAEEIEGREVPTVDEIGRLIAASASHRSAARAILARFGGGEGK